MSNKIKSLSQLEKLDYNSLSKYRSQIVSSTLSMDKIKELFPYPKILFTSQEINKMTVQEREAFKKEHRERKEAVDRKRKKMYDDQFVGIPIDWINRRLSQLYKEIPKKVKYKRQLDLLAKAKASAISAKHKNLIDFYTYQIETSSEDDVLSIIKYKFPALWYLGAKQFVSKIIRALGGKRYYKSGNKVSGSVYYELTNRDRIRVSDHELPETDYRHNKRLLGISGNWIELVLDHPKPFSELQKEVLKKIYDEIGESEETEDYIKETEQIISKIAQMRL